MKMRKWSTGSFETKMDMTPLIDCVFLLIMFFILTTQVTVEIEELTLPFALEGKLPGAGGDPMLLLNVVLKDPETREGRIFFNRQEHDLQSLTEILRKEVLTDKQLHKRMPEIIEGEGGKKIELSQLEILVRADQEVRSEYLRTIFTACRDAGLYKIKLASKQPTEF